MLLNFYFYVSPVSLSFIIGLTGGGSLSQEPRIVEEKLFFLPNKLLF